MKYQKECECCGHVITAYSHHLNKPLVQALKQLVVWYEDTKKPANLQANLNLSKNQYNNFQKLQYFGLVQRTEKGWYPTDIGFQFIYGEISVYNKVATFGKDILGYDHEAWKKVKVKPQMVFVEDIDRDSYKTRVDYQNEKSKQKRLFDMPIRNF